MGRQVTIRGVSEDVLRKLRALADARGTSVNALLVEVLERYTGSSERREQLQRYATWSDAEARAFDEVLRTQRTVDPRDWG
jgi:plasmid stability protein